MLQQHLFRDMALFVEVAKRKSFSRAAAALDMPISSLSRRIALFEAALGVRLIERTTRRLALTTHGESYLPRATQLVEEAQRAFDELALEAASPRVVLRIALPADEWVTQLVSAALTEAAIPEHLHVHITSASARTETDDLMVLVGEAPSHGQPLRLVGEAARGLCAAKAYLDRNGSPEHPRDLAAHRFILPTEMPETEWQLQRGEETASVQVSGSISCEQPLTAQRLARDGHGIVSMNLVEIERDDRLVRVLPDWTLPPSPVRIAISTRPQIPEARRLIDDISRSITSHVAGVESLARHPNATPDAQDVGQPRMASTPT